MNVRERLEGLGVLVEKPDASRESYNLERAATQGNPEGTHLTQVREGWHFNCLDAVPGPSGMAFEVIYPTLEQALEAVQTFYFGKPTVVQSWIIPLHQHPDWTKDNIERVIKNSEMISPEDFRQHIQDIWEKFRKSGPHPAGASPIEAHFLAFPHRYDAATTLQLRMDLSLAYIVSAPMSHMRAQGWLARARRLFGR